MHTWAFALFCSLVSFLAVYEIIKAVGVKNNVMLALSALTAFLIPFAFHFNVKVPIYPVFIAYIIAYFIMMVIMHEETTFSDTVISLFVTLAVPCSMSVLLKLRDVYLQFPEKYTKATGVYFILFAFFCSWATDSFAYITGRSLGKHKLCPNISPKKTVEGAVGGVLGAAVFNVILFIIFDKAFFTIHSVAFWQVIVISVFLSIISMFGDLSASVIKRNHDIKDFGNILPGHGGIMDRFDSLLFVLPCMYLSLYIMNL